MSIGLHWRDKKDSAHAQPKSDHGGGCYFLIRLGITSIKVCAIFYVLLFCYLGISSTARSYTKNLVIACADFDEDKIGDAFKKFVESIPSEAGLPTFRLVSSTSAENLTQGVQTWEYWGALYVNPKATSKLAAAVTNAATGQGDNEYNATDAITFVYDEGRFPLVVQWYVLGPVRQIMPLFLRNFSSAFALNLANTHPLAMVPATQRNPELMINPVSYSEQNLHPATMQVALYGLSVGMILLLVFSWVAWMIGYWAISYPASSWVSLTWGQKAARELTLLLGRVLVSVWICFIISLSFTLVWQGLGAEFRTPVDWICFWMLQWLHMSQYLFLFATVTNLVGIDKAPASIVLAIVFNATAGLNELSLAHPFYQWGVAMPMHHAVAASRTLIYGTKSAIELNVGVLAIWFGAGLLVSIATAVPRARHSPSPAAEDVRIPHYSAHGRCEDSDEEDAVVVHAHPDAARVNVTV